MLIWLRCYRRCQLRVGNNNRPRSIFCTIYTECRGGILNVTDVGETEAKKKEREEQRGQTAVETAVINPLAL